MIDKKTESDIKKLQSFIEFWTKFRSIYDETTSRVIITDDDEKKFLEIRDVIKSKYLDLCATLDYKYVPRARATDPVDEVLSITGIRLMSEKGLKKIGDDWKDSYIFLNSITERLKLKKKRLEGFNPLAVYLKRLFQRRGDRSAQYSFDTRKGDFK